MPLPEMDFDPTEASVPWKILKENDIEVIFATPSGKPSKADERMLTGKGFGILKKLFTASNAVLGYYSDMTQDEKFIDPITYEAIHPNDYSGIIIPGGHSPNARKYYESKILQNVIVEFFKYNKAIGAICHGVLLVARSKDPKTGKSVIYDYKTTSLLERQELFSYYLTCLWLGRYFKTYPVTVEKEVKAVLSDKSNFKEGNLGLRRDSVKNPQIGYSLRDKNYISARWFGDAFNFSNEFLQSVKSMQKSGAQ